jgi:hypothetical protein
MFRRIHLLRTSVMKPNLDTFHIGCRTTSAQWIVCNDIDANFNLQLCLQSATTPEKVYIYLVASSSSQHDSKEQLTVQQQQYLDFIVFQKPTDIKK